jgi:hypothetical protein
MPQSGPPLVDFSALGDLPEAWRRAQEWRQKQSLLNAVKSIPVNPDGTINTSVATKMLVGAGDIEDAMKLQPTYTWGEITKGGWGMPSQMGWIPSRPGQPILSPEGKPVDQSTSPSADQYLIDDDTAKSMARQALAGDTSVFTGLGYGYIGSQNRIKIRRFMDEIGQDQGITPEERAARNAEYQGFKAGERTLGTRSANVELAVQEAQNLAPLVVESSSKVSRTDYPAINKIIEAGLLHTGDPNVVRLGAAINSYINVYARAVNPTGVPTVRDKEHAREILDAAWSHGQIEAGVDQLNKEMEAARKSPSQVRSEFRKGYGGQSGQYDSESAPPLPKNKSDLVKGQSYTFMQNGQPVTATWDGSHLVVGE